MFGARFFNTGLDKSTVSVTFSFSSPDGQEKAHVVSFQWMENEDTETVIQRFDAYTNQTLLGHVPARLQGNLSTAVKVAKLSSNPDSSDQEVFLQIIAVLQRYNLEKVVSAGAGAHLSHAHCFEMMRCARTVCCPPAFEHSTAPLTELPDSMQNSPAARRVKLWPVAAASRPADSQSAAATVSVKKQADSTAAVHQPALRSDVAGSQQQRPDHPARYATLQILLQTLRLRHRRTTPPVGMRSR